MSRFKHDATCRDCGAPTRVWTIQANPSNLDALKRAASCSACDAVDDGELPDDPDPLVDLVTDEELYS